MKTLLVSGLVAAGMLGTGAAGVTLVVAPSAEEVPPSHVDLPEQAQDPADETEAPEEEETEAPEEETEAPEEEETEAPEEGMGEPASEEGREKRAAALSHVAAMQAWTACIAEAAPAHEASSGDFDPEAACGAKPTPPAANEADDTGRPSETPPSDAGAEGRDTAEQAQQGGNAGSGDDDEDEADEAGPPEGAGEDNAGPPDNVGPPAGAGRG
jgi:hypothetical protein